MYILRFNFEIWIFTMGAFSKIKNIIDTSNRFLLIGHQSPDGDCLGSLLAFGEFLRNLSKDVALACKDEVPSVFYFLPGYETIKNDFLLGEYDAVFLLDNGDFKRTGFDQRLQHLAKRRIPIVNIDHHQKNDLWKVANVNYVCETASSTCELIYELIDGMKGKFTPSISTSLLCGIYTDTGGFQHENTREKVFEITSFLLSKGAKLKNITGNLLNTRSTAMLRLWGMALSRLTINKKLGIASLIVTQNDLKKANASEDCVSGLVNLISSIPEAKISLLLYEAADGKIKGSLRTENSKFDVSKLARFFGGGGHKRAAGFSVDGIIVKESRGWKVA